MEDKATWPDEISQEVKCENRKPKTFQHLEVSNKEQSQQKRHEGISSKARGKQGRLSVLRNEEALQGVSDLLC